MAITITCNSKKCGYTTDIELTSETNPKHCPKCGKKLMIAGTGDRLYDDDGTYNKILFENQDEE